jgi:hypothetical protein
MAITTPAARTPDAARDGSGAYWWIWTSDQPIGPEPDTYDRPKLSEVVPNSPDTIDWSRIERTVNTATQRGGLATLGLFRLLGKGSPCIPTWATKKTGWVAWSGSTPIPLYPADMRKYLYDLLREIAKRYDGILAGAEIRLDGMYGEGHWNGISQYTPSEAIRREFVQQFHEIFPRTRIIAMTDAHAQLDEALKLVTRLAGIGVRRDSAGAIGDSGRSWFMDPWRTGRLAMDAWKQLLITVEYAGDLWGRDGHTNAGKRAIEEPISVGAASAGNGNMRQWNVDIAVQQEVARSWPRLGHALRVTRAEQTRVGLEIALANINPNTRLYEYWEAQAIIDGRVVSGGQVGPMMEPLTLTFPVTEADSGKPVQFQLVNPKRKAAYALANDGKRVLALGTLETVSQPSPQPTPQTPGPDLGAAVAALALQLEEIRQAQAQDRAQVAALTEDVTNVKTWRQGLDDWLDSKPGS